MNADGVLGIENRVFVLMTESLDDRSVIQETVPT